MIKCMIMCLCKSSIYINVIKWLNIYVKVVPLYQKVSFCLKVETNDSL